MALTMTRFRSRAMLTALIAAAMLTGTAAARVTYRRFHIVQEIRAVDAEIGTLKREKEELERTRDTLNDFATIEKAARELLSLRREGENVVVLLPTGEEPLPP